MADSGKKKKSSGSSSKDKKDKDSSSRKSTPKKREKSGESSRLTVGEEEQKSKIQATPPPAPKHICFNHNKPFSAYCESCEEPCCEDCRTFGHRVLSIPEAYRRKMTEIYSIMNTHLYYKKETLQEQINKRDKIQENIKKEALEIERDLRQEFSAIGERLNAAVGQKLALLQYDKEELQQDINKIQNVSTAIETTSTDQLEFLVRCKEITDQMEQSLAKPLRDTIDPRVDQEPLPKELDNVRKQVSECSQYKKLNEVKNDLLWKILNSQKSLEHVHPSVQAELFQWSKLVEKYNEQLEELCMKCQYCGILFDKQNANTNCEKNMNPSAQLQVSIGRHFWVHVSQASQVPVEDIYKKVREVAKTLNFNIEVMFKDYDQASTGYIKAASFTYLLWHYFSIPESQAEQLAQKLDPDSRGFVDYELFLREMYTATAKNQTVKVQQRQPPAQEKPNRRQTTIAEFERPVKQSSQSKQQLVEGLKRKLSNWKGDEVAQYQQEDGTVEVKELESALYKAKLGLSREEIQTGASLCANQMGKVLLNDFFNALQGQ